ncbi:MAG: hypothetical protein V4795_10240 [Pseudomonadota bacterium]
MQNTVQRPRSARGAVAWCTALAALCLVVAGCGGGDDPAPSTTLQSSTALNVPAVPEAAVSLLTHTMPALAGGSTPATSLLFVPQGAAPAAGWPVLVWMHGTTTVLPSSCAPSGTLDTLDGGLTAEGFRSDYAPLIASYVRAGYAVVAPDLEGIGAAATTPHPYYNGASNARALIAGLQAARQADPRLSRRWAAVGHSDGGRGVLALQQHLADAPGLEFRGSVAYAPFTSIAASVDRLAQLAAADPANAALYAGIQNFFVAMMATALGTSTGQAVDTQALMGADLAAQLPTLRSRCVFSAFGAIAGAVAARPAGSFDGFKTGWSQVPAMQGFLATNDLAVLPGFAPAHSTLIVQGTADVFVQEPLAAAFAAALAARGAPVLYRRYDGADHGSIVNLASADVLAHLAARFAP